MTDVLTLEAQLREKVGKGASRAMRRQGRIPAVIYGGGQPPLAVAVEEKLIARRLAQGGFMTSIFEVSVGGEVHRTLPRDVQLHPVNDRPLHVDFLRVSGTSMIAVEVPVRFVGEEQSPGLKRGGVLNVVRHTVELRCPADRIPEDLEVNVAGFDVGDSIHISSVNVPEDCRPTIDRDFTIATIVAPSGLKSAEAEAAGDASPQEGAGG